MRRDAPARLVSDGRESRETQAGRLGATISPRTPRGHETAAPDTAKLVWACDRTPVTSHLPGLASRPDVRGTAPASIGRSSLSRPSGVNVYTPGGRSQPFPRARRRVAAFATGRTCYARSPISAAWLAAFGRSGQDQYALIRIHRVVSTLARWRANDREYDTCPEDPTLDSGAHGTPVSLGPKARVAQSKSGATRARPAYASDARTYRNSALRT